MFTGGSICPERLTVAEYAALEEDFGAKFVLNEGIYWRRVRPFFYRPILPLVEYDEASLSRPCRLALGYQHAVRDSGPANSTLNFLVLDEPQKYSLDQLDGKFRSHIRSALKKFQVHPIDDLQQLKEQGHQAYLSFFGRTGYGFKRDRTERRQFAQWAEKLWNNKKAFLLGAFGSEGLAAVAVSYWVNDVLIYATFFGLTSEMQKGSGEAMLHTLREVVSRAPGIRQVVLRHYQGGNGMDKYYLMRGARLLRQPAALHLHPVVRRLLETFAAPKYAELKGDLPEARSQETGDRRQESAGKQQSNKETKEDRSQGSGDRRQVSRDL